MIISKDTNPERDLYYIGAQILNVLQSIDATEYDFIDLYSEIKKANNISLKLFSLALSWLFIIGAINHSEKGNIIKCF